MFYIDLNKGDKVVTLLSPMAKTEVEVTFVRRSVLLSNKLGKDVVEVRTSHGHKAIIDGVGINEYKTSLGLLTTTHNTH